MSNWHHFHPTIKGMMILQAALGVLIGSLSSMKADASWTGLGNNNPAIAFHSPTNFAPRIPSASKNGALPRKEPRVKPPLQMSSIPDEDDLLSPPELLLKKVTSQITKFQKQILPPLPEDHLALSGDVVALFVYSYLDHIVNQLYLQAIAIDLPESIISTATDPESPTSLPVWYDLSHVREFPHWLIHTSPIPPPYAPAIAHPGLAFVTISTCWILSGYFSGAFLHKNTLECPASRAITVTGKTWVAMAVLMVALALGSDAMWGMLDGVNPLSEPARGGLTKADADFIFDSLTVLAFWRFFFHWLLGDDRGSGD
mmetsp:Transcript_23503/g.49627  ORF Transcript_23503/g.49627 Transcript_23503/m.49627 type:complete len:314 (+) Transcript_23503:125-1066(+)